MIAEQREKHKGLHGLANDLHPWDKALAASSLLYSQVLITMNPIRVYIGGRVCPTWAYNILVLVAILH